MQNAEERKQFFNESIVLLSENVTSETSFNVTIDDTVDAIPSSNSVNNTLSESANVIISNLTNVLPVSNRTRRQASTMLSVIILYEFCKDPDLGELVGGRPTADGTLILITSDDRFYILNLAVASLFTADLQEKYAPDTLANLNKEALNEIYGVEQKLSIDLPLRVINELSQVAVLWGSPESVCLQRLELQLPTGKRYRLLDEYDQSVYRPGDKGLFVWFDRIGYCLIIFCYTIPVITRVVQAGK